MHDRSRYVVNIKEVYMKVKEVKNKKSGSLKKQDSMLMVKSGLKAGPEVVVGRRH